jgi:putative methylase
MKPKNLKTYLDLTILFVKSESMKAMTKARLAITLSKLLVFENPKAALEQYPTDSEIAAEVLWQAYMLGDIENKSVLDLGCGSGILGLGAGLLGASPISMIDKDSSALAIAKNNQSKLESEGLLVNGPQNPRIALTLGPVETYTGTSDAVIMNPPFGTRNEHADKIFVEKAMECARVIYSFHKSSTLPFLRKLVEKNNWKITHEWEFDFPLKATMDHHRRKMSRIAVVCLRLVKQ